MQNIKIRKEDLMKGTILQESDQSGYTFLFSKEGTGFRLPQLMACQEHLLTFGITVMEEHSLSMNLLVYVQGEKAPAFTVRFGLLPNVATTVCIDLGWMDASELFPEAVAGGLKIVCHGRRVRREEISEIVLSSMPVFHDVRVRFREIVLTDQYPENPTLPDQKLVDCFGQSKWKDWPGKTKDVKELAAALRMQCGEADAGYPFGDWSIYGGWKKKKLKEGTGYFSRYKENGRWWLTDPFGYAYFSMGSDCVGPGSDCRIDGVEKWLDWLPDTEDAVYGDMFSEPGHRGQGHRRPRTFSFFKANLYKAFGDT